jgi:hypothetical protein
MRQRTRTAVVAPLVAASLLAATGALTGCSGDAERTPTVASVNFDTELRLPVDDDGPLQLTRDGTPTTELGSGSLLVVTNRGDGDHRLVAAVGDVQVFDTGTLHPGDDATIVVSQEGELVVRDTATDRAVTLDVTRPG